MGQVSVAVSNGILFLATGGLHGYSTTLSGIQNGLEIDLSRLNEVYINKLAATMTKGGGTTFADILDPVYEAGFQVGKLSNYIFRIRGGAFPAAMSSFISHENGSYQPNGDYG